MGLVRHPVVLSIIFSKLLNYWRGTYLQNSALPYRKGSLLPTLLASLKCWKSFLSVSIPDLLFLRKKEYWRTLVLTTGSVCAPLLVPYHSSPFSTPGNKHPTGSCISVLLLLVHMLVFLPHAQGEKDLQFYSCPGLQGTKLKYPSLHTHTHTHSLLGGLLLLKLNCIWCFSGSSSLDGRKSD